MKFKYDNLSLEFSFLHPDVQAAAKELDSWSSKQGLPEVLVTHCIRTPEEQESLYYKSMMRQFSLTEPQARSRARLKPSNHLWAAAVDVRNTYYSPAQLVRVMAFLREGRDPKRFEILSHDVSAGNHIHIGCRDLLWKEQYQRKEK